jgi:hypothetical protein
MPSYSFSPERVWRVKRCHCAGIVMFSRAT